MTIYSYCGYITIGDTVKTFQDDREYIVKDFKKAEEFGPYYVMLYYVDEHGGTTISVPHQDITEVVKSDNPIHHQDVIEAVTNTTAQEDISKPKRYNKTGSLECWDVIIDQKMNFLEGNIIKYVWRYKEKNGVEDLKKAKVYLDKLISEMKKE